MHKDILRSVSNSSCRSTCACTPSIISIQVQGAIKVCLTDVCWRNNTAGHKQSMSFLEHACGGLFSLMLRERTRGNGQKLNYRKFHITIRKAVFTVRMHHHWSRLPREFVESLSLEIFKTHQDTALSNLLQVTMLWSTGDDLHRCLLPQAFCDSLTGPFNSKKDESGNYWGVEIKIKGSVLFCNGL